MKLVNWNIEWMNNWFVGDNQVKFRGTYVSNGQTLIQDVPALASRVAEVIKKMDPDILTLQEGPSDIKEMELFNSSFLRNQAGELLYRIVGFSGKGAQKIYALAKNGGSLTNVQVAKDNLTVALQENWIADVDGDLDLEEYGFTRDPLVVKGSYGGEDLYIVVLHTKSKFVQNQVQLWQNENRRLEFVRAAMKNRRRISAEGFRLRRYLDDLLDENFEAKIIVTGDWNDGPGNDYFERNFLTHNVSDVILGSTFYPQYQFKHSFLNRMPHDELYTAIFDDFIDEIPNRKILLDHIVVSPALENQIIQSGVHHDVFEEAILPGAPTSREKQVSDHRPIFLTI